MTQAFDIVIVGAGMVGAALATGLGRSGFRVALVDRGSAPEFDPSLPPDMTPATCPPDTWGISWRIALPSRHCGTAPRL